MGEIVMRPLLALTAVLAVANCSVAQEEPPPGPITLTCEVDGKEVPLPASVAFITPDGKRLAAAVHDGRFGYPAELPAMTPIDVEFIVGDRTIVFRGLKLGQSFRGAWAVRVRTHSFNVEETRKLPVGVQLQEIWELHTEREDSEGIVTTVFVPRPST